MPQPGPFDLKITASFAPPASWSKKRRAAAMDQYHTVKPDLDNILKAVCDGLNNLIWFDDSSIAHIFIKKIYAEPEGLKIVVGWGDFLLDRAETAA